MLPLEKAGLEMTILQIHLRLLMQAPVWDQAGFVFEGGRVCVSKKYAPCQQYLNKSCRRCQNKHCDVYVLELTSFSQLNGYYSFNFHSAADFSSVFLQTVKGILCPAARSNMGLKEVSGVTEKIVL